MTLTVVIAGDPVDLGELGAVRSPCLANEVGERKDNCHPDAFEDADEQYRHRSSQGEKELGPPDPEQPAPTLQVEERQRGSDHYRSKRRCRHEPNDTGHGEHDQYHPGGRDETRQLGPRSDGHRHRGARGAGTGGEALEEAREEVGRSQRLDLAVRVDLRTRLQGRRRGQRTGVGEGDQGNGHGAGKERRQNVQSDPRNGEGGQTGRNVAHCLDAGPGQVEDRHGDYGRCRRHDHARPEQKQPVQDDDHSHSCDGEDQRLGQDITVENLPHRAGDQLESGICLHGEPHGLGYLRYEDEDGDPVQVADADGFGEELGDHPEIEVSSGDADEAGEDAHCRSESNGRRTISRCQGQYDCGDDRGQGGVGTQDQLAVGPEHRVGEQRGNGGVDAGHRRQPGQLGIGHALWDQHGGQDHTGHQIGTKVRPPVIAQRCHDRDPIEQRVVLSKVRRHHDNSGRYRGALRTWSCNRGAGHVPCQLGHYGPVWEHRHEVGW